VQDPHPVSGRYFHLEINGRKSLPRALLVFNEQYELLGVVRRRDLLRGLEPKFLKTMPAPTRRQLFDVSIDPNLVDLSAGKIRKAIQEQAESPVSEVMQPVAFTVDVDDHLAKVIYKMVASDLTLIPVLRERKVIGVVRTVDVFHEVAVLLLD
jgi:predicted transcriptional regulator